MVPPACEEHAVRDLSRFGRSGSGLSDAVHSQRANAKSTSDRPNPSPEHPFSEGRAERRSLQTSRPSWDPAPPSFDTLLRACTRRADLQTSAPCMGDVAMASPRTLTWARGRRRPSPHYRLVADPMAAAAPIRCFSANQTDRWGRPHLHRPPEAGGAGVPRNRHGPNDNARHEADGRRETNRRRTDDRRTGNDRRPAEDRATSGRRATDDE